MVERYENCIRGIVDPMTYLSVSRRYAVSPEKAWDLLTDTTQWPRWGPSVRKVVCPDRHIRQGSRGFVQTSIGWTLPFMVTEYEHGHFWKWNVAGTPATGHRLTSYGENACVIAFEMPFFWLPYGIVCKWALKRMAGILEP